MRLDSSDFKKKDRLLHVLILDMKTFAFGSSKNVISRVKAFCWLFVSVISIFLLTVSIV